MAVLLCIADWAASRNMAAARFLVFLGLEPRSLPPLMRTGDLELIGITEFDRCLQREETLALIRSIYRDISNCEIIRWNKGA
jgi:hypothetical protein